MVNYKTLLFLFLFIASMIVHLIGLNQIGRTWDEQGKLDYGYLGVERWLAADFALADWNVDIGNPLIARYYYGLFYRFDLTRLDDLIGNLKTLSPSEINHIQSSNFISTVLGKHSYFADYDFTAPRLASAFMNSLAITLTAVLAALILDAEWALLAGGLLLFTPRFLVMGQLVTYESFSAFLYCLTALFFYKLLKHSKVTRYYVYVGLLTGLLFWARYNNISIFVMLTGWLILHFFYTKDKKIFNWKLVLIPIIALILGVVTWPVLWYEFPKFVIESLRVHGSDGKLSLEVIKYFIVTTPIPVLFGLVAGIIFSLKEKKYWQIIFLWWFFSTLIFFTIFGGALRYAYVVFPSVGILAAFGYFKLLNKNKKLTYVLIPLFIVLIWSMLSVFPYYLDYYNLLAGGTGNAAKNGYAVSWWGEGQREVGLWINSHLPQGTSVGLDVEPRYVFPLLRQDLVYKGWVNTDTDADYVVISGFSTDHLPKEFLQTHRVIYTASASNAPLVRLYQKTN